MFRSQQRHSYHRALELLMRTARCHPAWFNYLSVDIPRLQAGRQYRQVVLDNESKKRAAERAHSQVDGASPEELAELER